MAVPLYLHFLHVPGWAAHLPVRRRLCWQLAVELGALGDQSFPVFFLGLGHVMTDKDVFAAICSTFLSILVVAQLAKTLEECHFLLLVLQADG